MTAHRHVIVWIDHTEARVFAVGREEAQGQLVRTHTHDRHLHHKANSIGDGRAPLDAEFFHRVAQTIIEAEALLIVGPATAKTELVTYIDTHHPQLKPRIRAVKALDHPSNEQLIELARKFFDADDRLR